MALETIDTDAGSLSDHEATYQPRRGATPEPDAKPVQTTDASADLGEDAHAAQLQAEADARDPMGRFRKQDEKPERHRARSQQATADDVPQIRELTTSLREKEAALLKAKPGAGADSPRVVALRRQIRGIEAELADLQPREVRETPRETRPAPAESTFTEVEPKQEDFMDLVKYPDPYMALQRALAAYDRRKDAFDAAQKGQQAQTERARADAAAQFKRLEVDFARTTPDYGDRIQAAIKDGLDITPLTDAAIKSADNGPELLYHLLEHPDEVDDLWLKTQTTPLTDANIVAMRRRLQGFVTRGTAGKTAAASTPRPEPRAPKPPTAVRTGPLKTGTEPPDDGASLAQHEQFYAARRRR